jgi:hypothetical protein
MTVQGQNEPCHSLRRHGRSTSVSGPAGQRSARPGRAMRRRLIAFCEPELMREAYRLGVSPMFIDGITLSMLVPRDGSSFDRGPARWPFK